MCMHLSFTNGHRSGKMWPLSSSNLEPRLLSGKGEWSISSGCSLFSPAQSAPWVPAIPQEGSTGDWEMAAALLAAGSQVGCLLPLASPSVSSLLPFCSLSIVLVICYLTCSLMVSSSYNWTDSFPFPGTYNTLEKMSGGMTRRGNS